MRIASSGRNPSDKVSDGNEIGSMDNRSFDPDHEPRKEGTHKMKHSPSIAEILPTQEGISENASISAPGDRKGQRGSQSRSPGRVIAGVADVEESDNNYRSLNSDNKNIRNSNRKIKPIQYGVNNQGGKNIIKVMHQDEQTSATSNHAPYLAKNNVMQIVTSPQYQ